MENNNDINLKLYLEERNLEGGVWFDSVTYCVDIWDMDSNNIICADGFKSYNEAEQWIFQNLNSFI